MLFGIEIFSREKGKALNTVCDVFFFRSKALITCAVICNYNL